MLVTQRVHPVLIATELMFANVRLTAVTTATEDLATTVGSPEVKPRHKPTMMLSTLEKKDVERSAVIAVVFSVPEAKTMVHWLSSVSASSLLMGSLGAELPPVARLRRLLPLLEEEAGKKSKSFKYDSNQPHSVKCNISVGLIFFKEYGKWFKSVRTFHKLLLS